ncbi:branched-chain amino acid aminotransferase [Micromonospora haikouensis]|uniref:Branched-chain-amino-acid aminotransferase n=1 Tax=Micromonospora haikouensis TaxID=686309 RepID=A0A0D0VTX9_9ACTN|nr:branched-chain amino acid aminotransferase [Micromonospora haikouensis]KIR64193.1 branched-chain amino acid aminotransferase [Micromonospora haikouensis]
MTAEFRLRRTDHPTPQQQREEILADPGFGRHFTDHMVTVTWTPDVGWHDHQVTALAPFTLHPGAAVLHYAQEILEGLKAFRRADGSIWLFRPGLNARRFVASADRLVLPELDEETFVESVAALVRADEAWVPPYGGEQSLYLRPFMFASEAFLGVRPAQQVTYCVIACPAGSYFPNGVTGVTLWISTKYSRASIGGTGAAKCGGNYAASLAPQREALGHGCEQVLYLGGEQRRDIDESGTMNVFFVTRDQQLVTPSLGTILDGVTRDSVLALAAEHGLDPVQRSIGMDEIRDGLADGTVTEAFAAGTAAVITPIIGFKSEEFAAEVGDGTPGKYTRQFRTHLLDIQYGRAEDTHGWMHRVL